VKKLIIILFILSISIATAGSQNISLNFQDVKTRAVLQILAQVSGLNIIVSDSVQGNLSLHVNNISWQQALDIILQTQGLGKRQIGNVLLVAPQAEIAAQEDLARSDMPAQQVMVAARIVNLDSSYEKELGIRYSIGKPSPGLGGLNMDLPGGGLSGANGTASIDFALGWLPHGTLLDLELSALESEGAGQVISSPRVITADRQQATIESGEEIPYQQMTSSGATSVTFKKAVLSLHVTPQITPEGRILLVLKVNQDRANFSRLVQNVPPIDTRQIETRVLVDDGQTVVLGGIYQTDSSKKIERIPFVGALPLVGALFRHTRVTDKRTELLIFITPRIIKQSYVERKDSYDGTIG